MRWAFSAFALLFGAAAMPAAAQTPPPGCRPAPPAELVGQAADLDYVLTDTAGLNVVLVHAFGTTTLSDRTCLPDAEQGALQVVANYGVTSDTAPEEHAREMVFGTLARTHPERRPLDFPPITVEAFNVNGMPAAEAVSVDETESGVAVFRYALVFVFPDGAKGLLGANGPRDQFETLRSTFRRVAVGLRARRDVAGMQQDLITAMEDALARLRGPIVDQALDACLTAAFTTDGVISRATAAGFPAFGEHNQWRVSEAPADDSGRITLGVREGPSSMLPNRTGMSCVIGAARGFARLFRQRFDARFQGVGDERFFSVENGVTTPPMNGGGIRLGPGGGVGRASIETDEGAATIRVEVTALNQ